MTFSLFGFGNSPTRKGYGTVPDEDPGCEQGERRKTPPWGHPFDEKKAKRFIRDRLANEPGLMEELMQARAKGYDCLCSFGQGNWSARCDGGKFSFQFQDDQEGNIRLKSVSFRLDSKKQPVFP